MHVVNGRIRTSGKNIPGLQRCDKAPPRAKATKAKPKPKPKQGDEGKAEAEAIDWKQLYCDTIDWKQLYCDWKSKWKAKPAPAPEPLPPPSPSRQYNHDLERVWHKAFDEGWIEDVFMAGWVAAVRARDAWLQWLLEAGEGWIHCDLSARADAFANWSIQEKNWKIEESDQGVITLEALRE